MTQKMQRIIIFVIVGMFLLSTLAFTGVIVYSMIGDNQNDVGDIDQAEIEQMMEEQNANTEEGDTLEGTQLEGFEPIDGEVAELEIIDLQEGDGREVSDGADVVAHYTGAFATNGVIFQSSHDTGEPVPFNLDGVIEGWTEGVPGMKEGGVRRLVIPAEKAYGEAPEGYDSRPVQGQSPLGPLVFDIELQSIQ